MIKLVAMFRVPEWADGDQFDRYFVETHAQVDASKMPGLLRYNVGRVVGAPGGGQPAWRWVNELWFDSVEAAEAAMNSEIGRYGTNDLMPRVEGFTAVFVDDVEIELPRTGPGVGLTGAVQPARIRWIGHASTVVQCAGKTIYLDPWIVGNPTSPITMNDVRQADAICVTHGHNDHLGDAIEMVLQTHAPLVGTPEIAMYAERFGITYDEQSMPLNIGGTWEANGFAITMVNAAHTSEIMGPEYQEAKILTAGAGSVGYVLRFDGGPTIYYGGDTGVFGDMAIIRELYRPDVAILPVGGKYNMGFREAAYAAGLLQVDYFLPIHFDTFPNQRLDLNRFQREVQVRAPGTQVVRWKPGDTWEYR